MKSDTRFVLTVVTAVLFFLVGQQGTTGASDNVVPYTSSCEDADNYGWVKGENHCFAIATVLPPKAVSSPVLRIYLHGDNSRGRPRGIPSDSMYRYVMPTPSGTVSVAMLRPGHRDTEGRQSSSKSYGHINAETYEDIDEVAAAVRRLREHYNASRVVMIGFSGGCNTVGVVLGRHPGTADAALLGGCACDKVAKSNYHGKGVNRDDISPIEYVNKIPLTTKIIAVTGTRDETNPPSICEPFITRLKEREVSARMDLVEGIKHQFGSLARTKTYQSALAELNKE